MSVQLCLRRSALWTGTILLSVSLGLLSSCSRASRGDPPKAGAGRGVPVTAAVAAVKPMPEQISTFGSVAAAASVSVKAEITGALTQVHFRKGQDVKKGDLLFTIDPRSFQAAQAQAQANLARDKAQLVNAKREAERQASLLDKKVASQSDVDKSNADAEALAAAVRADEAAVETAKLQLEHCTIRSPIDARAGNILVDEGNLVKSGDTALVTLNQISPVEVFFAVPSKDLMAVQQRMAQGTLTVRACLPRQDDCQEVGQLTFVDNAVDKQTRTIQLGATFPNTEGRLWPGQDVDVVLVLSIRDAVVIPSQAVQPGRDGKYVFVIKDDKTVEMRPVTVGAARGEEVQIDQGLKPGEMVVTDGQFRLTPGAKAEIKPAVGGGPASAPVPDAQPASQGAAS